MGECVKCSTYRAEVDELDICGGVGERLLLPGEHKVLLRDQLANSVLVLLQCASGGAADLQSKVACKHRHE